jgi:stage V sporulation protein S
MITEVPTQPTATTLKVSAKSSPNAVAGALAAQMRERDSAELQAVGAGAINQAVKAVAIARSYLKGSEIELVCVPAFITIAIGDQERTGISIQVERRRPSLLAEPAVPEPAIAEPAAPEPAIAEPTVPEPAIPEPA